MASAQQKQKKKNKKSCVFVAGVTSLPCTNRRVLVADRKYRHKKTGGRAGGWLVPRCRRIHGLSRRAIIISPFRQTTPSSSLSPQRPRLHRTGSRPRRGSCTTTRSTGACSRSCASPPTNATSLAPCDTCAACRRATTPATPCSTTGFSGPRPGSTRSTTRTTVMPRRSRARIWIKKACLLHTALSHECA